MLRAVGVRRIGLLSEQIGEEHWRRRVDGGGVDSVRAARADSVVNSEQSTRHVLVSDAKTELDVLSTTLQLDSRRV